MPADFEPCVSCNISRVVTTLNEHHQCPFCVAEGIQPPEAPPKPKACDDIVIVPSRGAGKRPPPPPEERVIPRATRPDGQQDVDDAFALPYTPPNFNTEAAVADPARELAMRELCRRRFLPFVQRFRPKYTAGWVHEDICRRLERFVKEVEAGNSPRLLLMMPPRAGKSELGSRNFPPWVLGQHPDWEIISASHTSSLTLSFSRYIRDLVRDPAYQALYPEMKLDPSSQSIENWNTQSGGGYLAAGVGTGITGRGAHILLLDDLVKDMEAADSPTIRENTWEWYTSTAYTRLAPGGGVLGIMTWWSEDDWAGKVQQAMTMEDGEQFEIVKYPAINDVGDEYILPDDTIKQFSPESDPPPEGSRMTRVKGTALHPARYDTRAMLRIKNNMIAAGKMRIWNALYQQNPTPDDGIFFSKRMIQYYQHDPQRHKMFVYQAWDFAITEGEQNDWTVCVTIGQDEFNNLHIMHVLRFRSGDGNAIVEHVLDQYQAYTPDLLGFEDGQIWKSLASQFKLRCNERNLFPSHELLQPLTDKLVRAGPLKGRMQLGKVFVKNNQPWTEIFVRELMTFPAGKHDDQVDGASWCVRLTLARSAPKPPGEKTQQSKLQAMLKLMGAKKTTHMCA